MSFLANLKSAEFWKRVLHLGVVFFIIFVAITILITHFSDVFSGNFAAIYKEEWANGKWVNDLGLKAAISFVYAIYMVSRRQRLGKDVPPNQE